MRILWVKAGRLLPVDTGGKIRSYNILRQLAARHSVTLLSYYGGPRDEAYEQDLARHLPGAVTIHTSGAEGGWHAGVDYLGRLFWRAPYAVGKFTDPQVSRLLAAWLAERRYDVAVCDFLSASLNFPHTATPSVLFQHNVESLLWRRQSQYEPNWLKRAVFKIEAAKMARYERAAVGRFHHVIAVSEQDREQMLGMTDAARLSVVPTGVDLQQYRAAAGPSVAEPVVTFLGSMDWEANVDAVEYFCREVWPRVLEAVPAARFRIVGRNPHPKVRRLASTSVEVTGTVPSVVEYLRDTAVFVVPLRIGGGTRLKIFEAMAMGKAVVSTSVGAEGLDVHHDRDILLADDAAGFAGAVIKLLQDGGLRAQFERAAAEQAARYDWSVIAARFEEVIARVAQVNPPASGIESELALVKA